MKLYVGNLAFSVTDADLREVFAPFGTVTDSFVLMDKTTRRSRGFGFVTMGNQAEGEAAIAGLNGQEVNGRRLTINEARPMEERAPRGDGGGYGGGYGGGGGRSDDRRKPRRDFR
ncbi:MAG: RNA-binding protein [Verrucomicrobiae bacterium]|jgi:RNA recognition motif-containing protein|nr:RNA-binding protein [Verrucomicrobiae bacterium]